MVVWWHWGFAVLLNLVQLGAWSDTRLYLGHAFNMCIVIYMERRIILLSFILFTMSFIVRMNKLIITRKPL
jgi:hypothetical protein